MNPFVPFGFVITNQDGYELHLYINGYWCGYLDFDSLSDAMWAQDTLKNFIKGKK